jgi:uncharacterized protein (DUF2147 family)
VEIRPCGNDACGYVVWASAAAQADALKGSGADLIGRRVLDGLSAEEPGVWRGKVYIPDKDLRVKGTARLLQGSKGCLLGKFLCKSQVWTRHEV